MAKHFSESFGNPHSAEHSIGWKAAEAVKEAAARVAGLIGAEADEIIFTSGATEANNLALLGLGRHAGQSKRRRILISAIEHKCILAVVRILEEQQGYIAETLPVHADGTVDAAALTERLADDVFVVSIMAVNNEIGTIQDIERLSMAARKHGAFFHCDAAQAPCAIDLRHICRYVDLLSLSSHKMYGPQGIGALYIRRGLQDCVEPLIYGGGQQRNLRSGTLPVALCVGMGVAAELLTANGAEEERIILHRRRDAFIRDLMGLGWPIILNGPEGAKRHPGNANLCFEGFEAQDILGVLQPRLAASTGAACTSGMPESSHVLRAIGLSDRKAKSSIRFSIGRDTSVADLKEAVKLVDEAIAKLAG